VIVSHKSYVGVNLCFCVPVFIFFGNCVSYSIVILTIHLNCQLILFYFGAISWGADFELYLVKIVYKSTYL
jgi:hypothetical protein